jgi:hypothetical protein
VVAVLGEEIVGGALKFLGGLAVLAVVLAHNTLSYLMYDGI